MNASDVLEKVKAKNKSVFHEPFMNDLAITIGRQFVIDKLPKAKCYELSLIFKELQSADISSTQLDFLHRKMHVWMRRIALWQLLSRVAGGDILSDEDLEIIWKIIQKHEANKNK